MANADRQPGLGTGIYTYPEAAKLLGVSSAKVRRWADGYVCALNGRERQKKPVLQRRTCLPGLLTFCDLIELFFVREFRDAGVPLQDIRDAAWLLADRWDTPYPFAFRRLETDGRQILLQAGEQYENVARRQQVFGFAAEFFKNIDFDRELAERWWPLGREKLIVIDRHRSFGAPIDCRSGVRTEVIFATYKAEQDTKAVAEWYEIRTEAVIAAVEFEERWSRAA